MEGIAAGAAIRRDSFNPWSEPGGEKMVEVPFCLKESRLIDEMEKIEAREGDFHLITFDSFHSVSSGY